MKAMSTVGIVCAALLLVAAGSWADETCAASGKPCPIIGAEANPAPAPVAPATPERGLRARGEQRDILASTLMKLNLTEEQNEKIKPIREKQMAEMKALRENTEVPREEMWQKARELNEKHRAALMEILTEEQKAEVERLMAEARQQMRERQRQEPRERQGRQPGEGRPEGEGTGQRRGARTGEGRKAQ